jgi:hypothetical protein
MAYISKKEIISGTIAVFMGVASVLSLPSQSRAQGCSEFARTHDRCGSPKEREGSQRMLEEQRAHEEYRQWASEQCRRELTSTDTRARSRLMVECMRKYMRGLGF